jgi:hypothetical protein
MPPELALIQINAPRASHPKMILHEMILHANGKHAQIWSASPESPPTQEHDMNKRAFFLVSLFATCLAGMTAKAADEPATPPAASDQGEQHIMMDHSPADAKAMRMMKDKKVRIHKAGDPPPPDETTPGEEHIMMDHSPADAKGMRMMKDKKVKIHRHGEDVTAGAKRKPCEDYNMMDHSAADAKSMRGMKDKKPTIQKIGDCDKAAAPNSAHPEEKK